MNWTELLEAIEDPIHILGFVGQDVFFTRFFLQWVVSERRKESVIPVGFWWCSLVGGAISLVYFIQIASPPAVLGQCFGLVVYTRNLVFIYRKRGAERPGRSELGS